MGTEAWAVVIPITGEVYIASISQTRRAALINWLVTEPRANVGSWTLDQEIESLWEKFKVATSMRGEVAVVKVVISWDAADAAKTVCPGCRSEIKDGDLTGMLTNPQTGKEPKHLWHLYCHQKAFYRDR